MKMKEDGPKPKHCVVVLSDERGVIGHLCVRRFDRPPPWMTVWRHRQELHGPLAAWMRTLDKEPGERILWDRLGYPAPQRGQSLPWWLAGSGSQARRPM